MTNSSKKYWNKPFSYRLRIAISIALLFPVTVLFLFVGLRAIYNNPNFITIGLGLPYFVFGVLILGAYLFSEHGKAIMYYQFIDRQIIVGIPFFVLKRIPYQTIREIIIREYSSKYQVMEIEYENGLIEIDSEISDYEEFKEKLQQNCQGIIIEYIED